MAGGNLSKDLRKKLDEIWLSAGNAMRSRRYDEAILLFGQIIKVDKKNASAHNRLGIVYAKIGNYKKSLYHFKKSNKYENSASSEHNIGLLYYEIGKYKKAHRHLQKALDMEKITARCIALAKVCEKLNKHDDTLRYLEDAVKLEPSRETQQIYIDAYARHDGVSKKISEELLEAIQNNDTAWDFEILDMYPLMVDVLESLHVALQNLVFSRPKRNLNLKDENMKSLTIAYLHNLKASIFLLDKSYSLAGANIARSMFEIYLKAGYGMLTRSNRGFAEIEKTALVNKLHANNRLFKRILPSDPLYKEKVKANRKISKSIKSLDTRYVKLGAMPSYREISLQLDSGTPGKNYLLYEQLYERGSDIIHAEHSSISRSVLLSNTKHAGLFLDSYEIINKLVDLTMLTGDLYLTMPFLTKSAAGTYKRRVREISASIKNPDAVKPVRTTFYRRIRQPRRVI